MALLMATISDPLFVVHVIDERPATDFIVGQFTPCYIINAAMISVLQTSSRGSYVDRTEEHP